MNPVAIGLIPARGGSKGIPRKNLRPVAGKPLLAWTIEAALAAKSLSRVLVSTDDDEIAATARTWGAEVPFLRPASLAADQAGSDGVVRHAIDWLQAHSPPGPDLIVLLQPTSPLRTAADIDATCRIAIETGAPAVVSVSDMAHHPFYARSRLADGSLVPLLNLRGPRHERLDLLRRQDLPCAYVENGAIFLCRCDSFRLEDSFFPAGVKAYVMPTERALDIDSPWDLFLADLIMRHAHEYSAA